MKKNKSYPTWVCMDCGIKASSGLKSSYSTWHIDICDVCDEKKPTTEPRDFGYPKFEKDLKHETQKNQD